MPYPYTHDYEEKRYEPPKLKTDRNVWRFVILNILTLGFYSIFFFMQLSYELDKIAPDKYREKTMNYIVAFVLAYFTFAIVIDIWHYQISRRIEEALVRREIDYEFGTGTFWAWFFFGSFIIIGPIVYLHKLCRAMNLLCEDYNKRPELQ